VSEGLKIVALSARVRYGDAPEVPLHAAGHFGCGLPFNVFREKGCYVASMFVTLAIGRFASLMQLIDGFSVRFSGRSRLFCTTNLQIGLPSPPLRPAGRPTASASEDCPRGRAMGSLKGFSLKLSTRFLSVQVVAGVLRDPEDNWVQDPWRMTCRCLSGGLRAVQA
jgi:hypothetical protein